MRSCLRFLHLMSKPRTCQLRTGEGPGPAFILWPNSHTAVQYIYDIQPAFINEWISDIKAPRKNENATYCGDLEHSKRQYIISHTLLRVWDDGCEADERPTRAKENLIKLSVQIIIYFLSRFVSFRFIFQRIQRYVCWSFCCNRTK